MKLIRCSYGKKNTPAELREYRIDGKGPVGCLSEYKELFPNETFEIVDPISGPQIKCYHCKKVISQEESDAFNGFCSVYEEAYFSSIIDKQIEEVYEDEEN